MSCSPLSECRACTCICPQRYKEDFMDCRALSYHVLFLLNNLFIGITKSDPIEPFKYEPLTHLFCLNSQLVAYFLFPPALYLLPFSPQLSFSLTEFIKPTVVCTLYSCQLYCSKPSESQCISLTLYVCSLKHMNVQAVCSFIPVSPCLLISALPFYSGFSVLGNWLSWDHFPSLGFNSFIPNVLDLDICPLRVSRYCKSTILFYSVHDT